MTLEADAVIVGSGAGGSVIAAQLAASRAQSRHPRGRRLFQRVRLRAVRDSRRTRICIGVKARRPVGRRQRDDPRRLDARRRDRSSTGQTACARPIGCAVNGRRSTVSPVSTVPSSTRISTPCSSASVRTTTAAISISHNRRSSKAAISSAGITSGRTVTPTPPRTIRRPRATWGSAIRAVVSSHRTRTGSRTPFGTARAS